ncbi:MAG: hypothetical protein E7475_07735 [Ruminococcaceae bacterium]|nr:hypothetical protein [Oscillospiraceae bacterium]
MFELSQMHPLSGAMMPVRFNETVGSVTQLWVFPFLPVLPLHTPLLSVQYFPGAARLYFLPLTWKKVSMSRCLHPARASSLLLFAKALTVTGAGGSDFCSVTDVASIGSDDWLFTAGAVLIALLAGGCVWLFVAGCVGLCAFAGSVLFTVADVPSE